MEFKQIVSYLKDGMEDEIIQEINQNSNLIYITDPDTNRTILHIAAGFGLIELIKVLILKNSEIDALDRFGESSIFRSIRFRRNYATQLLLDAGANPNIADLRGITPLHRACEMATHDIVSLLLSFGSNSLALDDKGKTPLERGQESIYAKNLIAGWKNIVIEDMKRLSELRASSNLSNPSSDSQPSKNPTGKNKSSDSETIKTTPVKRMKPTKVVSVDKSNQTDLYTCRETIQDPDDGTDMNENKENEPYPRTQTQNDQENNSKGLNRPIEIPRLGYIKQTITLTTGNNALHVAADGHYLPHIESVYIDNWLYENNVITLN
ncbi:hypothetical protein HDV02_002783 [Globomyces sp. JEL0801]|nr:hypothetical protein HDV02_002783 [Globomyces sp. JEL0801]